MEVMLHRSTGEAVGVGENIVGAGMFADRRYRQKTSDYAPK
mgnify:FL=1